MATSVDSLTVFPFLNQDDILAGLKHELPAYIAKCSDVSSDMSAEEWWKRNSHNLPKWTKAARQVLLLQPSSAFFLAATLIPKGGVSEFRAYHPTLCEASVSSLQREPSGLRAT